MFLELQFQGITLPKLLIFQQLPSIRLHPTIYWTMQPQIDTGLSVNKCAVIGDAVTECHHGGEVVTHEQQFTYPSPPPPKTDIPLFKVFVRSKLEAGLLLILPRQMLFRWLEAI
jgi:hypothetical protein